MYRMLIITAAVFSAGMLSTCTLGDLRVDATPELVVHYYKSSKTPVPVVDAGAYVDLEYTWRVGTEFNPKIENVRAFVHFLDSEGNIIVYGKDRTLQDDHDINSDLKNWEPGEPQVYTHKMFKIPEEIGGDNFLVTVVVGLYDPQSNRRAELTWDGAQPKDRAYEVTKFYVRKNSKILPLPFDESWNGAEPPDLVWVWSKSESTAIFERDRSAGSVELVIAGHSPAEDLGGTQKMKIYIHKKDERFMVEELDFDKERIEPLRIPIPQELYNDEEYKRAQVRIIFVVDKYLKPGGDEPRAELGFMFHDLVLQPRDPES